MKIKHKYKYVVITFLYGENYTKIYRPLYIDDNVTYICFTDRLDLFSDVWYIKYFPLENIKAYRDKIANIKFNIFNYIDAEKYLIIDSTMEIKSSLSPLFNNDYIIGLKHHLVAKNLYHELLRWHDLRNLDIEVVNNFIKQSKQDNIELYDIPVYEGNVLLFSNNIICKNISNDVLSLMKKLSTNNDLIITNQCPLSYIIYKKYRHIKYFNIKQANYFNRYLLNENNLNLT